MSDYFHEQMINKMLQPKERDFSCKECFIFKIEEERVNQFIANYKEQRTFLRNAEIIQALEDVEDEIDKLEDGISSYSDDRPWVYKDEVFEIIEQKIKEIKHE